MPATKWDTSLLAAKCVVLKYTVDPNDIQQQTLIRGYKGLSYASAGTIKTALDAQGTVTSPVIDGVTFTGTWTVDTAEIVRIESGELAGSHEVRQNMRFGVNTACMSVVNERLVRSRAFPLEQNENGWMYYELMRKEETKKWVNLSYAAALAEYEYLWRVYNNDDIVRTGAGTLESPYSYAIAVREYMVLHFSHTDWHSTGVADTTVTMNLFYGGLTVGTRTFGESLGNYTVEAGKHYIVGIELSGTTYYPTLTLITNPVFETWYEEERNNTYTMYRTLKETSSTPIMRNRVLQYAGMARVKGNPVVGDGTITIYGLNDEDTVIHAHTKFRIGNDVYRVKADCSSEDEGEIKVWKPTITPEVTDATDELVDAGDTDQTQVYFMAL